MDLLGRICKEGWDQGRQNPKDVRGIGERKAQAMLLARLPASLIRPARAYRARG
jgi:hypothetical protein